MDIPHYGKNAISTLLPALSNRVDGFMVIVAGYPEPMERFISSNDGLGRRFPKPYIQFDDFLPEELTQVFLKRANEDHIILAEGTAQKVADVFDDLYRRRDASFGNAGEATMFFDRAISKQSNRLAQMPVVNRESLMTLYPKDIPSG